MSLPCQTFLFLSLKPTRMSFSVSLLSLATSVILASMQPHGLCHSDSFSKLSAVRHGVFFTKALALSSACRGARFWDLSSFRLVRYHYLLLLSFVFYYSPGSECLILYLCPRFNFHLPCFSLFLTTLFYGDSTVLLFSPQVVCQTLSFLNVWPPSLKPPLAAFETVIPWRHQSVVPAILACWLYVGHSHDSVSLGAFTHLFPASTAGFLKLLHILLSLALSQVELVVAPGSLPAVDTVEDATGPPSLLVPMVITNHLHHEHHRRTTYLHTLQPSLTVATPSMLGISEPSFILNFPSSSW